MLRTIYQILLKALGKDHPTVREIAKNLEDQSDKKVTSIPTKTKTPKIATNELDVERGSKEQIEEIINEFGELSDLGEKGVSRLPIAQQGNAFRNAKRLERKLLQDRQGIMGTDTAKIFDMDTGREVGEKGIKSLLRERGRKTPPGEDSLLGAAEDIKDKVRMMEQDLKPTSMKDFLFGNQPGDRLIANKFGPEAKKMLQEKTPDYFTMGDDLYQASNARIIRQAYENYPPDKADKVVGYYNRLSAQDKARRELAKMETAQAPVSIMTPATRAILQKFSDEGKIKLSPDTLRSFKSGSGADPIEQYRRIFGEENLEVLDDYVANVAIGEAKTAEELAENFVRDYPNKISKNLKEKTGGVLTPRKMDRELLSDREKAQFLTNNDGEGNPLTPEMFDYLKRNIEPNDPFITDHIMQYSLPRVRGDKATNYIKNLPDGYDPPEEVRVVLGLKPRTPDPDPELFAEGGRVDFKVGGLAKVLKTMIGEIKMKIRKKENSLGYLDPSASGFNERAKTLGDEIESLKKDLADQQDKLKLLQPEVKGLKDKSGEFHDIFDQMYEKTEKKRTLNASGGLAYMMGV